MYRAKKLAKRGLGAIQGAFFSFPRRVACTVCGWQGRRFLSDPWHKFTICPRCRSDIRQRLFFAALRGSGERSFRELLDGRKVLHFAPEDSVRAELGRRAGTYVTADYFRTDCDRKLDMTRMPELRDESFDVVIAFDVLEHVPDYKKALAEVRRVLSAGGTAIFTVPQKDGLATTDEDPAVTTPEERTCRFGQHDHLRLFGDDFADLVATSGFTVTAVDESFFPPASVTRHVLFPPVLSLHPLATNHRKVFFCRKK